MDEGDDDTVEIRIERNSPWWTGMIGVNRVKKRAEELADAVERSIERDGGEVLRRGTF